MFMGDNGMVEAVGRSFRLVETRMKGYARNIKMHDVFHISELLSVSKLVSRGLRVHFNLLGRVERANNGEVLAITLLELKFVPTRHECFKWSQNELFGTFIWKLTFCGIWAQKVGASQRE
jgi:hypothetical protein